MYNSGFQSANGANGAGANGYYGGPDYGGNTQGGYGGLAGGPGYGPPGHGGGGHQYTPLANDQHLETGHGGYTRQTQGNDADAHCAEFERLLGDTEVACDRGDAEGAKRCMRELQNHREWNGDNLLEHMEDTSKYRYNAAGRQRIQEKYNHMVGTHYGDASSGAHDGGYGQHGQHADLHKWGCRIAGCIFCLILVAGIVVLTLFLMKVGPFATTSTLAPVVGVAPPVLLAATLAPVAPTLAAAGPTVAAVAPTVAAVAPTAAPGVVAAATTTTVMAAQSTAQGTLTMTIVTAQKAAFLINAGVRTALQKSLAMTLNTVFITNNVLPAVSLTQASIMNPVLHQETGGQVTFWFTVSVPSASADATALKQYITSIPVAQLQTALNSQLAVEAAGLGFTPTVVSVA